MKEDILLTSEERAVVMGGLLGDSTLQKRGKDSYRLSMGHSVKQTYYTLWKYNKLKRLCKTTKPPYIDTQTKTDGKEHNVITFYTSTFSSFAQLIKPYVDEIPDMLYKLGKKNQ